MTDIMIIGEAWGEKEEELQRPFVGPSGWLLDQMLSQVGISRKECYLTNVINFRPKPSNDIINLCGPRTSGVPGFPSLIKGKFLLKEHTHELTRLYQEINRENPNVIIAFGATAAWALTGSSGIRAIRGSPIGTTLVGAAATGIRLARTFKVLPTYHPAAVLRDWTLRPIVLADLDKARRHSGTPELSRPSRSVWLSPDLADLARFEREYIEPASRLSIDIETKGDQITCIGFAPNPWVAITIPFYSEAAKKGNYWPTLREELAAWNYVRRWCQKPSLFQNGCFDAHRLWRTYGIACTNMTEDTMLAQHAMQPEMEKGLGFLGSLFTDEPSWKFMHKSDTLKRAE